MINSKSCGYCKQFLSEVFPEFNISKFPIIIIDDEDKPEWFFKALKENRIKPYRGTPYFIIWDEIEKYEINRIVGYLDRDTFYRDLEKKLLLHMNK